MPLKTRSACGCFAMAVSVVGGVAFADVTTIGEVIPDPTTVTSAIHLIVGDTNSGAMTINTMNTFNGLSSVSNRHGLIGNQVGGIGHVDVDGAGATWSNAGQLHVGHAGDGTLVVTGGGMVSNAELGIVASNGGVGNVSVDGLGSVWTNSTDLRLGGFGTGILEVTANGNVTVNGEFFVGHSGTADLTIGSSGSVTSTNSYVGYEFDSSGDVTVDGVGSTWASTGVLHVGRRGAATLTVSNEGAVSNTGISTIGSQSASVGMVTVDGDGSTWTNSNEVWLGKEGIGTVKVLNGGDVTSVGEVQIGRDSIGTGTVEVDGAGSTWDAMSNFEVGNFGMGTLMVTDGGVVTAGGSGVVGNSAGSTGTASIDGVGSAWANDGILAVGNSGGGTLMVTNGASVSSGPGIDVIGNVGGVTGEVTVDGAGSSWSDDGQLWVGNNGHGTLTIRNQGNVSNVLDGLIGVNPTGDGTVIVDGVGSQWDGDRNTEVGSQGKGVLEILNGGLVTTEITGFVGTWEGSDGMATVNGAGSLWDVTAELHVGVRSTGVLVISNGGAVTSAAGRIGRFAPAGNGDVTVENIGSSWAIAGLLFVGESDTGLLTVLDGGAVTNVDGLVGSNGGSNGQVQVGGTGSLWTNTNNLYVGGNTAAAAGVGVVTVSTGGTVAVGDLFKLWHTGTVRLEGGTLDVGDLDLHPSGTFDFAFGELGLAGDEVWESGGQVERALGSSELGLGRSLRVGGELMLNQPLVLDGGGLSVGSVVNVFLLDFKGGRFNLTGGDLDVSVAGLFGDELEVLAAQTYGVAGAVNVATDGRLNMAGGRVDAGSVSNAGVIQGRGRIDGTLSNVVGGEVRVGGGDVLRLAGAVANDGLIEVVGGEAEFDGVVTNTAGALVFGAGATMRFDGGLTNDGDLGFSLGTSLVSGTIDNTATGRVRVLGGGHVTFLDDILNDGEIEVSTGSTAVFFGALTGSGTMSGGGSFDATAGGGPFVLSAGVFSVASVVGDVVQTGGVLAPGNSPGTTTIDGDYSLQDGRIQIEVGGLSSGSQHDVVAVTGGVSLDGTLEILTLDGFTPVIGDEIVAMTYGSEDGSVFASIDGAVIDTSLAYAPLFESTRLVLRATVPGDTNLDNKVSVADLSTLALNFGTSPGVGSFDLGDFNGDGEVTVADLSLLALNFGFELGVSDATGLSLETIAAMAGIDPAALPEPAAGLLLAFGGFAGALRRGRRA